MTGAPRTLAFRDDALYILDQTALPATATYIEARDVATVAGAIRRLAVRGAPAIGLAAAYGVVVGALAAQRAGLRGDALRWQLEADIAELRSTRPTAVNLFWALERMRRVVDAQRDDTDIVPALLGEADRLMADDEATNRRMGEHGAALIPDGANIVTHCNTGMLATGAFGTALGVIRSAHESGKQVHVWVDETRPLLQGARLTTWELEGLGIPYTLITDNMAGHFMKQGRIDLAMVGADRIAANGDAANKIGTYSLAVLARFHRLPFYVVAPTSTVDLDVPAGDSITIEERRPEEVTQLRGVRIAPEDSRAANPAFDVTPAHLISGIVTEAGVVREPFPSGLVEAVRRSR
ncbi:MAG TPA: S-methyl-5-thioribose-1-phosphate isomerase [Chloroflexota bacterium]|nr:S-methyl-5-thioribose-1-phosphate isomerase [Chloroflexota bacterium]